MAIEDDRGALSIGRCEIRPLAMKYRPDWFLLGMIGATALAWAFPEPGSSGGWMHPELLTKAGVSVIFFLHGVALSFAALKAGTMRWRLHVVVQAATFLFFPLLGLGLVIGLRSWIAPDLILGIFYLCALPSTVSSSVALTAAARGNVVGAVFNATLSSLLGIFVTPLWMAVVLKTSGQALPVGPVVVDLIRWLVLPLVLGQLCRPLFGAWVGRHKARIGSIDRATILVLIYTSFCDSFKNNVWADHGLSMIVLVVIGCGVLFGMAMLLIGAVSSGLQFPREDRVAAMFCGSKKTLASGIPMANLIFGAHPGIGLILLPIMIYHPLQLIICGVLAERWGREVESDVGGVASPRISEIPKYKPPNTK